MDKSRGGKKGRGENLKKKEEIITTQNHKENSFLVTGKKYIE